MGKRENSSLNKQKSHTTPHSAASMSVTDARRKSISKYLNINYGTLIQKPIQLGCYGIDFPFLSISFVCVMRSKIQLPAWSKPSSKPLFVLFECGILLSALQASLNLHQHYSWRPESTRLAGVAMKKLRETQQKRKKM